MRFVRAALLGGAIASAGAGVQPAFAHKPAFATGEHASLPSAFVIEDVTHSIVVYQQLTCDTTQLWMRFDRAASVYVQLGIPAIERLALFRPVVAVLAPGLPPATDPVPFAIPEGFGIIVLESQAEPAVFDEPFTGTRSWVRREETLQLPQTGAGYIVAWHPDHLQGKLWVAVGTKERFSLMDLLRFPKWRSEARQFHELDGALPSQPATPCDRP